MACVLHQPSWYGERVHSAPLEALHDVPSCFACPARSNGYPWSFSKCDFDDFNGWADAADAVLQQRGVDINKYKYK